MKYTIHIDKQAYELIHDNMDSSINVDDLTIIDTSNIFGEATTISAAVNRIGLLKAEIESRMSLAKLDCRIYEADLKANLRKQAANNGGFYMLEVEGKEVKVKLTEKALETCFENDTKWIEKKKYFIKSERNFNALSSLYWACQDKSRKLNGLVNSTTPEEFIEGIIQGKVNGILIKKK